MAGGDTGAVQGTRKASLKRAAYSGRHLRSAGSQDIRLCPRWDFVGVNEGLFKDREVRARADIGLGNLVPYAMTHQEMHDPPGLLYLHDIYFNFGL